MRRTWIAIMTAAIASLISGCAMTPNGPQAAASPPAMQGANDVQGSPIYSGPAPGVGVGVGIGAGSWGHSRGAGIGFGLGW